jgi:hypothetical protein
MFMFTLFPFYKDIVAATSGGGNRDVVIEMDIVQKGRFLHRFPHSKVCSMDVLICARQSVRAIETLWSSRAVNGEVLQSQFDALVFIKISQTLNVTDGIGSS